jgi:hypothetical protein
MLLTLIEPTANRLTTTSGVVQRRGQRELAPQYERASGNKLKIGYSVLDLLLLRDGSRHISLGLNLKVTTKKDQS